LSAALHRLEDVVGRVQGDGVTALDGALGAELEDGEGLDGQLDVGRGARHDELGRERVDLVDGERGVEGRREWRLAERRAHVRGVTRFDRQHGAGVGQVRLRHDVGGGAEVGADADTLEDGGEHHEGLRVRDAEVVGAFVDGLGAGGWKDGQFEHIKILERGEESTGESASQELDVGLLVLGDGLQVVVEGGVEAGGGELLLGVVGQTLAVELVLEVLQGERIVEDWSFVCQSRQAYGE